MKQAPMITFDNGVSHVVDDVDVDAVVDVDIDVVFNVLICKSFFRKLFLLTPLKKEN
jgi:hypothetical protein